MVSVSFISLCITTFSCLTPPSHAFTTRTSISHRLTHHQPTNQNPLSLAANDEGGNVPFFASFLDPIIDSNSGSGISTVTTRLPLGTLFDSRDYILNTATNVRGYEWTLKETDELLDDLSDAALGLSPNPYRGDYELSQIVLVPMEWDRDMYGLGGKYDVHDGQQRLVTLSLLFAALRELFRDENGSVMADTVEELTYMLNPPKVRKAKILRIELRKRDNKMLKRILRPELMEYGGGVRVNLPPPKDRKTMSATNKRVVENYERLYERLEGFSSVDRVELLDYLVENVYMLVCVPETSRIARNIVMAQGKGMDNEPIDDFKGLVCFRYIQDEKDMYKTFDKWDNLAATPDADNGYESVGRETIASACVLRATSTLRSKVRKNAMVPALEQWLRQHLIQNKCEGNTFFDTEIKPASFTLAKYRDGTILAESRGEFDDLGKTIAMRLRFLRGLTKGVGSTKEVEMVILELLLRAEGGIKGGKKAATDITLKHLDQYLHGVELAALYMALIKPSTAQRQQRCFDMLDAIQNNDPDAMINVSLSQEEKALLKKMLVCFPFGETSVGKKIAAFLLERLNAHFLTQDGDEEIPDGDVVQQQIEHVLPKIPKGKYWNKQWPDQADKDTWTHRLGNLVLMSRRVTAKQGSQTFPKKKERYENEVRPLTRNLSKIDVWNKKAMLEQQGEIMDLVSYLWGL